MQRRFVSDVSHELRTPLTTVRMAGDVLHDARERLRPGHGAVPPSCCRRSWTGSRPLLADLLEISRFDAGAAVLDARGRQPRRRRAPGGGRAPPPLAEQRGVRVDGARARPPVHRPRPTYAGSSGSCATWSPTPSTTPSSRRRDRGGRRRPTQAAALAVRDHGVGLAAGRGGDGVQPVLAGRPGAGPDHRRHRPRSGDLAGGRPPARRLAAGLGRAGQRRPVPAHPAAAGRRPAAASPLPLVPADAGAPGADHQRVDASRAGTP